MEKRTVFDKNWLVHKIHDRALEEVSGRYLRGRLIDIGCGAKPYADLLRPYVSEHVGLDTEETRHDRSHIDLFGSAYRIPAADGAFDSAICTAVLEHLEEPAAAIREARRVLKPGGHAVYTAPLFWHVHEEPRDFFRYTEHGLRYLLEGNGFEVVELRPLSGFFVTFGQELVYYLWGFRREGTNRVAAGAVSVLGALIQAACYILNRYEGRKIFTWMYMVVARAGGGPGGSAG